MSPPGAGRPGTGLPGTEPAGASRGGWGTGLPGTGPPGTGPPGTGRPGPSPPEIGRPGRACLATGPDRGRAVPGHGPAGGEPARAESIAAALAGPEPVHPDPADPEPIRDEPAGREPAGRESAAEEPTAEAAAEEHADEGGSPGQWSPAPLAGNVDWARPVTGGREADVDPAADWERLAAGAQAAGSQAARWRAQTDADVANEWPGPPLRTPPLSTPLRNGLLGGGAVPRPAADQSVDDAQTDPGLPGPRPATEEPGRTEASPPAPPQAARRGGDCAGCGRRGDLAGRDLAGFRRNPRPRPGRHAGAGSSGQARTCLPSPTRPTNGSACSPPTPWTSERPAPGPAPPGTGAAGQRVTW